jgi:hypothetical protein
VGYVPALGDVIRLDGLASPQFAGDRSIILRVTGVDRRPTCPGYAWLRGDELNAAGEARRQRTVFVELAGLRRVSPSTGA